MGVAHWRDQFLHRGKEKRAVAAYWSTQWRLRYIVEMSAGFFQGLSAVTELSLPDDPDTFIRGGAFQGLESLQTLDLSKHQIANITANFFAGTRKWQGIDSSRSTLFKLAPLKKLWPLKNLKLASRLPQKVQVLAGEGEGGGGIEILVH